VGPGEDALAREIEAAVTALESRTDAEVVVVIAGSSGSYRDVWLTAGAAAAWVALVAAVFSPLAVHPAALPLDTAIAFAIGAWLASGPRALRALTRADRRSAQVALAAAAACWDEAVHSTPARVGVLVYWSRLEGQVVLLPDVGIDGRVPRGAWADVQRHFAGGDGAGLHAGLQALGDVLAARVPRTGVHAGLELSDAPRIRP